MFRVFHDKEAPLLDQLFLDHEAGYRACLLQVVRVIGKDKVEPLPVDFRYLNTSALMGTTFASSFLESYR